jgi:hypothetical protein
VRDSEIVLFPAPTLEYWCSCLWLAVSLERFSLSQYGVHQRWCSCILHDCKSSLAVARWYKQTNICSVADRRCVESSCMFRLVGLIPDCNGFMGNPLRSKLGRESELQHLLQIQVGVLHERFCECCSLHKLKEFQKPKSPPTTS